MSSLSFYHNNVDSLGLVLTPMGLCPSLTWISSSVPSSLPASSCELWPFYWLERTLIDQSLHSLLTTLQRHCTVLRIKPRLFDMANKSLCGLAPDDHSNHISCPTLPISFTNHTLFTYLFSFILNYTHYYIFILQSKHTFLFDTSMTLYSVFSSWNALPG